MIYGRLTRVTPPADLPLSVTEFAGWLRADPSDTANLELALRAAVDRVDGTGLIGGAILPQQWEQEFDRPFAGEAALVGVGPLRSVDQATVVWPDGTTESPDPALFEHSLDGCRDLLIIPSAASGARRLTVRYTSWLFATPADVPHSVRAAIALIGAVIYDNRGSEPVDDDVTIYRAARLLERWRASGG